MTKQTIRELNKRDNEKGYRYDLVYLPMRAYQELTGFKPEDVPEDFDQARGKMRAARRTYRDYDYTMPQFLSSKNI